MANPKSSPSKIKSKTEHIPGLRQPGLRGFAQQIRTKKFSKREALTAAAGLIVIAAVVIVFVSAAGLRKKIQLSFQAPQGNVTQNSDGSLAFNSSTTTPPTPASGKFYIVGNQIVDPSGNIFYPMGVNIAARAGNFETGYTFNWNGTGTGRSEDVLKWGWNTVRVNNICSPPSDGPTVAQLNAGIDAFIDEYTAKKIVVMIDCHDVTGKNPTPTSSALGPIYAFQEHVAQKYKDNPYVWFNVLNEPITGSDTAADSANWLALYRQALSKLRAIAPNSIFVADIPGYGQAVKTLMGTNSVLGLSSGQCNVLYAWHAYGAIGDYNDMANETKSRANHKAALEYLKANKIPVVIGELGDPLTLNEGTAGQPIWNRIGAYAVMDYAPSNGIGLLWWHATGDSDKFLTYSLMADRHQAPWSAATSGVGLSAAGQKFWQISKNKPNLGKFTGNLRDSGCASAQ